MNPAAPTRQSVTSTDGREAVSVNVEELVLRASTYGSQPEAAPAGWKPPENTTRRTSDDRVLICLKKHRLPGMASDD
jgi:hypothetical protein